MNIQKLKDVIIKANPEIMELKFGCYFSGEGVSSGLIVRMIDRFPFGFTANYHHQGSGIMCREFNTRKIVIIGRSIRLADVLLAMGIEAFVGSEKMQANLNDIVVMWNLKDNNLDNQSDECKEFLDKLLVK